MSAAPPLDLSAMDAATPEQFGKAHLMSQTRVNHEAAELMAAKTRLVNVVMVIIAVAAALAAIWWVFGGGTS